MNTLSSLLNFIGGVIGANPNTLTTSSKTLVGAINEVDSDVGTLSGTVSSLSSTVSGLSTTATATKDYVTAKGTDSGWTYRKWNSGKVEAWFYGQMVFNGTTAAGSVWYGDATLTIPDGIFESAPHSIAVPTTGSDGTTISAAVFSLLTFATSSTSVTVRAFRATQNSSSGWRMYGAVYTWTD